MRSLVLEKPLPFPFGNSTVCPVLYLQYLARVRIYNPDSRRKHLRHPCETEGSSSMRQGFVSSGGHFPREASPPSNSVSHKIYRVVWTPSSSYRSLRSDIIVAINLWTYCCETFRFLKALSPPFPVDHSRYFSYPNKTCAIYDLALGTRRGFDTNCRRAHAYRH